jgi:hypothetical protein
MYCRRTNFRRSRRRSGNRRSRKSKRSFLRLMKIDRLNIAHNFVDTYTKHYLSRFMIHHNYNKKKSISTTIHIK